MQELVEDSGAGLVFAAGDGAGLSACIFGLASETEKTANTPPIGTKTRYSRVLLGPEAVTGRNRDQRKPKTHDAAQTPAEIQARVS